jgi:NitT/TauT family transport system permease protein
VDDGEGIPASALPRIFVGVKVAAPLCVIGAVIGEFFGSASGLGYAIRAAGAESAVVYAALLLLAGMSLAVYYTVVAAELVLLRWARQVTA